MKNNEQTGGAIRCAMNLSYSKDGGINGAAMVPHSTGLYVEWPDYDALREHAERLACVLEDARAYFRENEILDYDRVMEISIDDYRAAYPKEAT